MTMYDTEKQKEMTTRLMQDLLAMSPSEFDRRLEEIRQSDPKFSSIVDVFRDLAEKISNAQNP